MGWDERSGASERAGLKDLEDLEVRAWVAAADREPYPVGGWD